MTEKRKHAHAAPQPLGDAAVAEWNTPHTQAEAPGAAKSANKKRASAKPTSEKTIDKQAEGKPSASKRSASSKSASKKRGKKSRKRSILRSKFYRVYFVLVLVCLVGIGLGMRYLHGLLEDYEIAQPVHVAESAAKLFEDMDYDALYDYDTSAAELGERDFYVERMRELAAGKQVSWTAGYSPSEDERVYDVRLDGERFAQIALKPSGRTTDHGDRFWTLDSITTFVTLAEEEEPEEIPEAEATPEPPSGIACHITVPSDSTVIADGVELTEADAVTTGIPTASDGLLPDGVPSPTLTEYVVYSETGAPVFEVTDKNGNPQTIEAGDEHSWSCGLSDDPALKAEYESAVVKMAENLARCSAKTMSKDEMLRYCAKGSPAYQNVSQHDQSTGANRKQERFENVETSQYYSYSEDCFSCHVTFDYLSKFTSKVIKTYPITYTLYFVRQGNSGKLYNFTFY